MDKSAPSPLLLVAGLAALVVGISVLIGPSAVHVLGNLDVKWVFVVAALVVGGTLLIIPGRRK